MAARLSWGKWSKHRVLSKSSDIKKYLPDTRWLDKSNLAQMADRYSDIIVKPSTRSGGVGVVRICKKSGNSFEVQMGRKRFTVAGIDKLYGTLRKHVGPYALVQQRIRLAEIGGRPFDVRVMVQRKPGGKWKVTGKLAKIAGPGYIITNLARSGGRIASFPKAVRQTGLSGHSLPALSAQVDRVALSAARQLQHSYRYLRIVGLDMGIDREAKPWIIEANFAPSLFLFRILGQPGVYRRILEYRR